LAKSAWFLPDSKKFYRILRGPLTTPREAYLVAAIVESTQNQVQVFERQLDQLMTGCKRIVEGREPDEASMPKDPFNNPRPHPRPDRAA
jgi:hypothetical protein